MPHIQLPTSIACKQGPWDETLIILILPIFICLPIDSLDVVGVVEGKFLY